MKKLFSNNYGTHRPYLVETIKNTKGNIIEFGCGDSSTLLIRDLIKNTDRKLISLESNYEWYNKFKYLENENHKLFFVNGREDTEEVGNKWLEFIENNKEIQDLDFDICFLDSSPWISRTVGLNYFKNKAKYILVHDVDYFPLYKKWGTIIKTNYSGDFRKISRIMDFSDVINNYHVFYPDEKYYAAETGPPTLLCSNKINGKDFENMCNKITKESVKYYR